MNLSSMTDDEYLTLQRVHGLDGLNLPAHAELLEEAAPLVAKGWLLRNGVDLSIPDDVKWALISVGKPLKSR